MARGTCTIGGDIATNVGGNQVLRRGMTRGNMLVLEALLPDGRGLRALNKMMKNNTGFDLPQLMIGSEGTPGVFTGIVLALHPPPAIEAAPVADTGQAIALPYEEERRLLGGLQVFEAMWREFFEIATGTMGRAAPLPPEGRSFCHPRGKVHEVQGQGCNLLLRQVRRDAFHETALAQTPRMARRDERHGVRAAVLGRICGHELARPDTQRFRGRSALPFGRIMSQAKTEKSAAMKKAPPIA